MLRRCLSLGLCAGASLLALSAPVRAQTAPKAVDAIPEVVVTAQRRTQNLQDVPISLNTFNSDFIKQTGAQDMGDLQQFTPGLTIDNTSTTQPTYTIRGISGSSFGIGTEPAVGIYVDGVYTARSGESLVFFDDVAQVEVLKGPQGTLFGRNTSAGAISITTNKPTDAKEMLLDVKYGNYNKREASLMVNTPLTDTLDLRIDGILNRRDGYIPNLSTGKPIDDENNQSARVALRWRPNTNTDVVLSWDHDNTDHDPPTSIGVGALTNYTGNPFKGGYDDEIGGRETRQLDAVTLNAVYHLGGATLTSITAYRQFNTTNLESETGTYDAAHYFDTENVEHNQNVYQEFRVNGVLGKLTYLAGGSYYYEHGQQNTLADALTDSVDTALGGDGVPPLFGILSQYGVPALGLVWQERMNNDLRSQAASLFGDATYAVTPALHVTAGIRFTDDQKRFQWEAPPVAVLGGSSVIIPGAVAAGLGLPDADIDVQTFAQEAIGNFIFPTAPLPQGATFTRSAQWSNVSPRFVVDYRWTPQLMTFASASYGYKAGGFNSVAVNSIFSPETVQNFELGLKSDWFNRRVRFNASAYYYQYQNQQSLTEVTLPGALVPEYVTQTGDSAAKGVDVELHWLPVHDLTLSLVTGYIDSEWTKRLQGEEDTNGSTQYFNVKGQPTGEPDLRAVFSADYSHDLGQIGVLRFHADHSFTSAERFNDATNFEQAQLGQLLNYALIPNYRQAHNLTNARLTWEDTSGKVQIAFYVENLFDNHYVNDPGGLAAFTLQAPIVRPADPPRFYGVEIVWRR